MTEREKIIKIIAPYVSAYGEDEAIADALIAAGYGEVEEAKRKAFVYSREIAHLDNKLKETEHRAEVAEKALSSLCDDTMRRVYVIAYPSTNTQVRNKQELYDYYIRQAEKELAEEKKDDERPKKSH